MQKVGPIGHITLKTGENKYRRNILVADDTKQTCVICFWSDRHLPKLDTAEGEVLAILAARVSDFSNKSLNSSEDSKVVVNPDIDRLHELRIWFEEISHYKKKVEFHPLSGTLNVETHGMNKEQEIAEGLQNPSSQATSSHRGIRRKSNEENPEDTT